MTSELATAWLMSCSKTFLLFDAIPEASFSDRYSPRTRSVASQFAHLHNVRVYHLERRAPEFLGKLESFPRGAEPSKRELRGALEGSQAAVAKMLAAAEETGTIRQWKGPLASYLGYFCAHEAHHRGLVLVSLRLSGTKLPKEVANGLWYWREKKT